MTTWLGTFVFLPTVRTHPHQTSRFTSEKSRGVSFGTKPMEQVCFAVPKVIPEGQGTGGRDARWLGLHLKVFSGVGGMSYSFRWR